MGSCHGSKPPTTEAHTVVTPSKTLVHYECKGLSAERYELLRTYFAEPFNDETLRERMVMDPKVALCSPPTIYKEQSAGEASKSDSANKASILMYFHDRIDEHTEKLVHVSILGGIHVNECIVIRTESTIRNHHVCCYQFQTYHVAIIQGASNAV